MTTLEEGKALVLKRFLVLAVLVAALCPARALAAPATVQLRVEGATSTIYEGPVTTAGKAIDKGDGSHPCDGTTATPPQPSGPTMTSALDDASIAAGFDWDGAWFPFGDFLINRIGPDAGTATAYWGTVLNYQPTAVGGCQQQVANGDDLLFALGDIYAEPLLKLAGPAAASVSAPVAVTVTDGKDGSPVAGASVGGAVTGVDGKATLALASPGLVRLKATKPGAIRSNALAVCVSASGTGDCAASNHAGSTAPSAGVHDSRAPFASIASPRNGRRYRVGPRLLKGTARDDETGLEVVKLSLRRHSGSRCRWWGATRERFSGRDCHRKVFFAIGAAGSWSYLLPRSLPPGRYVLDVEAFDRARNRNETFRPGGNRAVFYVTGRRARPASAGRRRGSDARRGPRVEVMVVGRDETIAGARSVALRREQVRVSGHRCTVGAATPLAALVATLRAAGVPYHVHDFGRCSPRSSRSSGQLFVDGVGRERNRGDDGWFYKVDDRGGTSGAGDVSAGRLRSGDRVLWFYCVFDRRAGGCQRSLRIVVRDRILDAGDSFTVNVRSYDNEGRPRAAAGALVRFAGTWVTTGRDGRAVLSATSPGRYRITASSPGTVPAFPLRVVVRPRT
jgi:hypothetical protein